VKKLAKRFHKGKILTLLKEQNLYLLFCVFDSNTRMNFNVCIVCFW
jgi:hypothetical protein